MADIENLSSHVSCNAKEGRTVINVDSPMWMQQLSFYKDKMTDKLQGLAKQSVSGWERSCKGKKKGGVKSSTSQSADDRSYIEKLYPVYMMTN